MRGRRAADGFSVIELLIVLCILGVLVRLAMPAVAGIRRDAVAAQAAGDFNTVRAAAVAQYEATGSYAADAPEGVIPAGMGAYLPHDFSFRRPAYSLDWEHFVVSDTTAGAPLSGQVLALTVAAPDSLLGLQVVHMLGSNCAHWSVGDAHTFVVFSSLEAQ